MVAAGVVIIVVLFVELNAFFLKFVLWIPPPHPVNVARLVLWWSIGLAGTREFYQWATDPNCKRFGLGAWICSAVVITETLVWLKFSKGLFPNPHPPVIVWSWIIGLCLFVGWAVWYYSTHPPTIIPTPSNTKTKSN